MKKLLSLLLVLLMAMTLGACSNKGNESVGMANPMVEYDSLEAINKEVGVKLAKPENVEVTNEKFYVIDGKIAEYDFTVKEANFTFRAAKDCDEDISGIYVDGKLVFEGFDADHGSHFSDDVNTFFFVAGDDRFNMSIDTALELDVITDIIMYTEDQIYRLYADPALLDLLGEYQDMTSQRATMKIALFDDETVVVGITWSSSADEYDEWGFVGEIEDGKLEYEANEFSHAHYNGSEYENLDDYGDGYFEIKDDGLYWTGSGNELTEQCVFVKVVE